MVAKKAHANQKHEKRNLDVREIQQLTDATAEPFSTANMKYFKELPVSSKTKEGLQNVNYTEMTEIQKSSFGYSLAGRDILGAAKTGSGKTLAFLIPLVECLYKQKWGLTDGLGALVISPTRELALQIFGVLRKIGKLHSLSAGLIIGGKDVEFERERINRMNILICTPGRLLQHMDSTPNFNCNNLQMLVLDEADRILDMGFSKSVNAIIENLPKDRQTLLYSATQTKSVRDLARLSLKDPEYVAVHEQASKSTPDSLVQNYLVCELPEKLDILFNFLRTHTKSKILVFISSCKQVRFVHEAFCKMQPGIVLMCLHGKQRQEKRNVMFEKFCHLKAATMFCTDIAARGLDFPAVDWVIQLDCPEDGDTYIHRVGRTARFNANGRALLFLSPREEEGMMEVFEKKKIPVEKIAVNPKHLSTTVTRQLQSFCAQDPETKYLGEKAFICYVRSIWLQKDKKVFDVLSLPLEEYASSLGLPGAPNMKLIRQLKDQKNKSRAAERKVLEAQQFENTEAGKAASDDTESDSDKSDARPLYTTKADRMFAKKNQSIMWSHYEKIKERESEEDENVQLGGDDEEEGGFLKLARKDHDLEDVPHSAPGFYDRPQSVRDKRNIKLKNRISKTAGDSSRTKITFDDEGTAHLAWQLETEKQFLTEEDGIVAKHQKYMNAITEVMQDADSEDKALQKEKLREKRRLKKLKQQGKKPDHIEQVAVLGSPSDDDEDYEDQSHYSDDQSDEEGRYDEKSSDEEYDDIKPLSKKPKHVESLSLKEQEDLALSLLQA